MATFQETVDEIRSFVAGGRRVPADLVELRSTEYSRACREVNDRLRKCHDALLRGLRSDAIHLAEAEPNLLDLVAMLDFPELAAWKQLCLTHELLAPPELLIEMAGALNEAYASELPLSNLMANHRVMALARAPLDERLTVMRRIAELDPASNFWDDDIRKFEQARVDEIRAHLVPAMKANDTVLMSRLRDEAEKPGWRISIPQELIRVLQDSAARLESNKAIVALRGMLPALNDAYGAMAYNDCRALLNEWSATASAANLTVPADLQDLVDPIFGWVQDEDTRREKSTGFAEACTFLEQAIDRDQSTPSLERAYQAVIAFHLEVPDELDKRYRQRLAARATAIRHRRRLIYTGIAAAFILIAGGITFVAYQHILAVEVGEAQATLTEALNDVQQGDLEKGQSLKKELVAQHPRILNSPLITKQINDFDTAVATERLRETDFQQHMQAAIASGVEKPSDKELDQATSLAKTTAETAQIDQFKSSIEAFRLHTQQDADRRFATDGLALGKDLDQKLTPQMMTSDPGSYSQQLEAVSRRVDELRQRPGVSARLKEAQLASLDAVLGRDRQELDHQQIQGHLLDAVRTFGSTAEKHASALKQFIAACPEDPHCSDFQLAIAQLPQEQAVEEWSALVSSWSTQMVPLTSQAAKDRVTAVQQYIDRNATSPVIDSVQAYQAYLKLGLDTVASDGPWKGKLSKLLSNPVVGKLYYLDTPDGKRYYVTADTQVVDRTLPAGGHKEFSFNAITSPDLSNPTALTEPLLKSTTPARSPQALFAEAASNRIESLGFHDWDVFGADTVQQLASQSDMNPVLRAILLQHVLQLNQPTAVWSGEDGLGKVADALVEQNVEDIEWLDPRHAPDRDVIKKLQSTIDQLSQQITKAKTEVLQRRTAILQGAKITIVGEGILLRDKGAFQIVCSTPCAIGQTAFAIGSDKKLEQIGQANDAQWLLDKSRANTIPEGSLVFIVSVGK